MECICVLRNKRDYTFRKVYKIRVCSKYSLKKEIHLFDNFLKIFISFKKEIQLFDNFLKIFISFKKEIHLFDNFLKIFISFKKEIHLFDNFLKIFISFKKEIHLFDNFLKIFWMIEPKKVHKFVLLFLDFLEKRLFLVINNYKEYWTFLGSILFGLNLMVYLNLTLLLNSNLTVIGKNI
ncbi:hypothetical protein [Mammaliicoccus sp. C-M14]|uniref:hypothetical protein n=1 Tax=Mammaliicoccus sp. C-M14 TaxID=2898674 RepID=UPI001EFA61B9|nr:hypothetical protein [Mammaliicoccus sp. C-M14]